MNQVGITGATGYIGSALSTAFRARGWTVVEMGRSPHHDWAKFSPYHLESTDNEFPAGLDLVVHCAYNFGSKSVREEHERNITPTLKLFAQSQEAKCRFVYISSQAAFPKARSIYGQGKYYVEEKLLSLGALVIRPGLVTGPGARGLVPSIQNFLDRFPIVPVLGLGQQAFHLSPIQPLVEAIVDQSLSTTPSAAPIVIAQRTPITFAELLRSLAKKNGKKVFLVPVPSRLVEYALRILEGLGIRLSFRSDSVVGLIHLNSDPSAGVTWVELH